MAKRKVDEALELMQDSLHEWSKAARKVIRYGNPYDFEEWEEQFTEAVEMAQRLRARLAAAEELEG